MQALLVIAVALALGYATTLLPWRDILTALRSTDPLLLGLAAALQLGVIPFWVWQWGLIASALTSVRWRGIMAAVALSIGAKVSMSGLAGVSAGVLALKSHGGLTYSQAGALMSLDQFFALATKLLVLLLALMLAPLPRAIHLVALSLLVLGVVMVVALVFARHTQGHLDALASRYAGMMSRLISQVAIFLRDAARVGTARVVLGGLGLAVVKRAFEIAAALAVLVACGLAPDPVAALLVVAAVSVTTLVPVMPANLGTHPAGVFAALVLVGAPADLALAAGLLHHAVVLATSIAVALLGIVATGARSRAPSR